MSNPPLKPSRPFKIHWQEVVAGVSLGLAIIVAGVLFLRFGNSEVGAWVLAITNVTLALLLLMMSAFPDAGSKKVWQGRSILTLVGIALSIVALALAVKDVLPPPLVAIFFPDAS